MADWRRLVQDVAEATFEQWADADMEAIKKSILDFLGVALAASATPPAQPLRCLAESGSGPCTILGLGRRGAAETAALVNGTLGHVLDFDDTTIWGVIHPSVALVPALLAVAESRGGCDGRTFLNGYAAGFAAMMRLAAVVATPMYSIGWHNTGTLGAVGAALACAALLRLDAERTAHCLGIACSGAGGLRENFGSMTKPLHAGKAARTGVTAALLAEAGFTANSETIMGGALGFLSAFARGVALDWPHAWPEIAPSQCLGLKKYPCCFASHPALDLLLAWRTERDLRGEDIRSMVVEVNPRSASNLRYPNPTTGLQGKFSLHHAAAVALATGRLTLADFTDAAIERPELAPLRARIQVVPRDDFIAGHRHTRITVTLNDGRQFTGERVQPRGAPPEVLGWDEVSDKFRSCAAYAGLPAAELPAMIQRARSLEQLADVRALLAAAAQP